MKKTVLTRTLAALLALCMILSLVPMAFAADEGENSSDNVEILFLNTSDMHGQLYATDYTAAAEASGTYRQGWTRVATYLKEQRALYDNVFLSDTGDTVQGTPLTYYYAFEEDTLEDPSMKVLRTLDYDMWVLGNHEFNYGMTILDEQIDYVTSAPSEGEDQVALVVANYLDAATNSDESKSWETWDGHAPYLIKEYEGIKVAIMGLGNPNIPNWDVPENWEGIYFANPIDTYLHYEAEMQEAADVIVLVSHSGIDSDPVASDFIRELVETTCSIDLAFTGHEHRNGVFNITNSAGKEIPVIAPSTKAAAVGRALMTVDPETKEIVSLETESVQMTENKVAKYEVDAELEAILKPYEAATWEDYMLQPIGTADGNFPAANLGSAPSAFMDLINKVQLYYSYDYNGENTPDDPSDDTPAQLSISAPLTSGSKENLISEGDIVLGDMFSLYRYENWFYQITMSGKEVRTWLEAAATLINDEGQVTGYDLTYYDVIYGEGFSYILDYAQPDGSRVVSMTYNGAEVADDDTFTVVVNNYRYNGGGGYVQYLNDNGCEFIANDPDRVIYSTQYDMNQGEDQGQARNMLANYIRLQETISPVIDSTWSVISSAPAVDPNPFTDVAAGKWYAEPVVWALENGITAGTSATTFSPDLSCTRAQIVTMLWAAAGKPEPTAENPFTDVSASDYYYKAVLWAVENGITFGSSATTFSPDADCTRSQAVALLYQAANAPEVTGETGFSDVAATDYYYNAVLWAVENGITAGTSATTFGPDDICTRAQIVTFLYQAK